MSLSIQPLRHRGSRRIFFLDPTFLVLIHILAVFIVIVAQDAQIGDSRRSDRTSTSFFSAVDTDHDDTIDLEELSNFVGKVIGGTQFDTPLEIQSEVNAMFKSLDLNHDKRISFKDVKEHWNKLECLLTADEVAEWVKYAVQLPENVANTFRDNAVTGFDFSELVVNNGEALERYLGIEKELFRKKLLRLIKARMLGVGTVPDSVLNIKHSVDSCSSVSFTWDKPIARGFPVHSYRIQRRAIMKVPRFIAVDSTGAQNKSVDLDATPNESTVVAQIKLSDENWADVFIGADTEFVDTGLELGYSYIYRIQAWNAVGRSPWRIQDISSLRKKRSCFKPQSKLLFAPGSSFGFNSSFFFSFFGTFKKTIAGLYHVLNMISYVVRCFFTFVAMAAAIMRLRKGSTTSTGTINMFPLFPFVWNCLNALDSFCTKRFGTSLIPEPLLTDVDGLQRAKQDTNISSSAVGMGGVTHAVSDESGQLLSEDERNMKRAAMMHRQYLSEKHFQKKEDGKKPKLSKARSVSDFRFNMKKSPETSICSNCSDAGLSDDNIGTKLDIFLDDNRKSAGMNTMETYW
eukprot:CAMPEP_0113311234 /NCGR_PEP_ID=MMETSP0010_2-20120614/8549_1 /TAXON_ID=216773 ORGANISM="Corethron hystrix, Strain 308" /NCGR_SAMPLE_ID=MMETSP0010_2 /ASSEMBLY_ACC=CAM_ASM_000155 /LENGTH=571 /DNA_ID=CAMNT_0000166825 /DNA_START=274 /DNA_END=1986 /DNA_ORIENTATION=+ /assembly_acc=CAM_ASM_000155